MNDILIKAIEDFKNANQVYTKFITPNDTGVTGGHQSGYHIHKDAWALIFDKPGSKGEQKDNFVTIKWQDDFETSSRFIYYGKKTRNEYRLTRFGKGFPFLTEDNVGDLLILYRFSNDYYKAYVLSHDEDIENFLTANSISITDTDRLISYPGELTVSNTTIELINKIVGGLKKDFPTSKFISEAAKNIFCEANKLDTSIASKNPDNALLSWIDTEYQLFKAIEEKFYTDIAKKGFKSVEELINIANSLLNRRKSRAGKALENHLCSIFDLNKIKYETQVKTEKNKKPDFIFPDGISYHNISFDLEDLFFLGAKTTCKDRWRQILNEAARIETKHLMTLQQGISKNQLEEMEEHKVVLVVPETNRKSFPKEYRNSILSLGDFIKVVKESQK
ncbi:MAG: restriction endonuclease [Sphingobacteriales bacterium]|nr:restriction endonuclease [Sphingobacteriales bacterium]